MFDRLVYGFHPYGMPQTGTPESIAAITRDDLVAFHAKYFVPNNAILAIVGDVTAEEAFDGVKKVFGDWARKDVPIEKFIEPPTPTRRLIVVNKPDAVQTEVRVGHIGIPRKHPDYMAVNLAIRILGGEGSNRLHNVLRTQRALTYGAQANMDALKESGDFVAQTNTRSEATAEVLRLTFDEFWRLQRDPVSERELADAKAYMTGSFPLTIETPDAIAMQVLNVVFYGLPIEDLQNFRDRVNAVTVDDIQRVARAYLRPDRLSVVLVGNVAAFGSTLKGVGFNSYETVELGSLDLTAADFKRAGGRARRRGAAAIPPGVLARSCEYQPASAGSRLDGATGRREGQSAARPDDCGKGRTGEAARDQNHHGEDDDVHGRAAGAGAGRGDDVSQYPDHVRVETKLPDMLTVQVYDGQHAWVRDPQGLHDVPAPFLRDLQASLKRDAISLLLAAEQGAVSARALQDTKDDAGIVRQALELSGADLEPVVLYIDPSTGLIVKQSYRGGRRRPAAHRGDLQRLSAGGRRAGRLCRDGSPRRTADAGAPRRPHHDQPPARPRAVHTPGALTARLMLSCGETSGDLYAGALTRELRALDPTIHVRGVGGPQFAAAGGELIADYRGLSVTGFTAPISKLGHTYRRLRTLLDSARAGSARRAHRDRHPRLQFLAGARGQASRHPDRVLHQPADLGVAWRSHQDDEGHRGPRDRHLSVRGADLPRCGCTGDLCRTSADRSGDARRQGGVSPPAGPVGRRADGRDPSGQPGERADADSSGPGARRRTNPGTPARRAIHRRARARSGRCAVRRPLARPCWVSWRWSKGRPTRCCRRPTSS